MSARSALLEKWNGLSERRKCLILALLGLPIGDRCSRIEAELELVETLLPLVEVLQRSLLHYIRHVIFLITFHIKYFLLLIILFIVM